MKKKYIKIISSCIFMLCMSIALVFTVFGADTSETKEIQYVLGLEYAADNTIPTIPEDFEADLSGYLFAGWYTQNGNTYTVVSNPTIGGTYYAKFVPEEVLSIKAQVSANIIDGETDVQDNNAIRLVTSLDSTHYEAIGFHITRGTKDYDADTTNKVYKTLYAIDATEATEETKLTEYVPSEQFHSQSVYFKTWTISKIPEIAFNTDITVTPYWITLDGTRVEGTTSIKTVNLGRSWVYINTEANNTDKKECGTYDHPFTSLADALNEIVCKKNGKIIIQENATITMASDFAWSEHGKDLTITGEGEKTETLDFSNITNFRMGDSVTFENMTLKLPTGQLYCNGHRFEIAENVVSDNEGLIIFGGDNKSKVTGDTSVTLLSGSYEAVYGGGLGQDVDGDTHVTIRNANVNSKTTPDGQGLVCGGGRKGDVTGNTYVTVGENFNKDLDVFDSAHTGYSKVCGGGYGDGTDSTTNDPAVVEKNTYVYIEDGAKVIYVYGAGYKYSDVNGKSYVECNGGEVMSIYGGCAAYGDNASTSVVMNSGIVDQIFGGNESGMTGNTDVRVLGGTVNRRVYGGCYNNSSDTGNYVTGATSVAIGGNVKFDFGASSLVERISANSRYNSGEQEEVGILIFNDGSYNANYVLGLGSDCYDYLVQATEGGAVYSEGESIRVTPTTGKVATVRLNSANANEGTVYTYMTSEGVCSLQPLETVTDNIHVVFAKDAPTDVDVSTFEAQINEVYYVTIEDAMNAANTLSTTTEAIVVKILKDVEVESTISVTGNVALENTNAVTVTATGTWTADDSIFKVTGDGILAITGASAENMITIASGENAIYAVNNSGDSTFKNVSMTGGKRGVHNNSGTVELSSVNISDVTDSGIYIWAGDLTVNTLSVQGADGSAINVRSTAGNIEINGADLFDSGQYGLIVKGGTAVVKNTDINNQNITEITRNRIGIAAHGGSLTLDNVKIQNFIGNSTYKANHGIEHQGGELIVTANETVDGGNPGLYIYNVKGHGIYSTGGVLKISKITIQGNSQTRAGIQLTNNTSDDNYVINATITGCSVPIQLKSAKIMISSTLCEETAGSATNYNTDGTKK